jgi:diguanylate cyclase (GGDEF)-like protein
MGIRPGTRMRIFIADLDHLKQINDLFGHGEGDSAIMTLTQAFREALPEDGLVSARIGGDEFLLFDAQADLHDPAEEMSRIRNVEFGEIHYRIESLEVPPNTYGCCISSLVFCDFR